MSSGHREDGPRSSIVLGRHMRCSASTTRPPSPRIEDGEGVVSPRSATDSTEHGYAVYAHVFYVVMCYMSIACLDMFRHVSAYPSGPH